MKSNKRRVFSKITSAVMAITISAMLAFTAFAANSNIVYSSDWGYYTKNETSAMIPALGKNKDMITLTKCFQNKKYGRIVLGKTGTVSSMNVWLKINNGVDLSNKYKAYPDGNNCYIYYYDGIICEKGKSVTFVGEQFGASQKNAVFKAYGY